MVRVVRLGLLLLCAGVSNGVLGCGQAAPSPSTSATAPASVAESVAESVAIGPLEYRLTAKFTPDPTSSDRERLTISLLMVNTSDTTTTLYPSMPELSIVGANGSSTTLLDEGERESRGWGIPPGVHGSDVTAALDPAGYFRFDDYVYVVARGEKGLEAHVRAQPGRDFIRPIR